MKNLKLEKNTDRGKQAVLISSLSRINLYTSFTFLSATKETVGP